MHKTGKNMPFKFDGRDYHLLLSPEEFNEFEKRGRFEVSLTDFREENKIGARLIIYSSENKNPEGVELVPSYGKDNKLSEVNVALSRRAAELIRNREHIFTTYGVTDNKVRIGVYPRFS